MWVQVPPPVQLIINKMKTILIIATIIYAYALIGYIVAWLVAKIDYDHLLSDPGEINVGVAVIWPVVILIFITMIPFTFIKYLFKR